MSATGTGRERTPWRATQRAAWEALRKRTDKAFDQDRIEVWERL